MPTYDYRCEACKHEWEEFHSMSAKPTERCPKCNKKKAKRMIGPGAGLIFKGSGFYLTDYRSDSYKKGADAAKQAESSTAPSAESKSDSSKSSSTESKSTGSKSKKSKSDS